MISRPRQHQPRSGYKAAENFHTETSNESVVFCRPGCLVSADTRSPASTSSKFTSARCVFIDSLGLSGGAGGVNDVGQVARLRSATPDCCFRIAEDARPVVCPRADDCGLAVGSVAAGRCCVMQHCDLRVFQHEAQSFWPGTPGQAARRRHQPSTLPTAPPPSPPSAPAECLPSDSAPTPSERR